MTIRGAVLQGRGIGFPLSGSSKQSTGRRHHEAAHFGTVQSAISCRSPPEAIGFDGGAIGSVRVGEPEPEMNLFPRRQAWKDTPLEVAGDCSILRNRTDWGSIF
jgi:hypothetical protein